MAKVSAFSVSFAFLCSVTSVSSAFAASTVKLETKDLDAVKTIIKPETNALKLDGLEGNFIPNSQLQTLGVEPEKFPIDLGTAGDLADIRFNNLHTNGLVIAFEAGRIRLEIPFADQEKGIRSTIGAINFKGVSLVAWVKPVESFTGTVSFVGDGCELRGTMTGTGLIGAGTVAKIHDQVVSTVKAKLTDLLAKPSVADAIEKGIVKYAQFSQNALLQRYVPASLAITDKGIAYQAE